MSSAQRFDVALAVGKLPSWAFVLAAAVPLLLARVAWGLGGMQANVGLLELSSVSEGATRIGIMSALVWARRADPWVNAAELYVAYAVAQLGAVFYLVTLAGIPQGIAAQMMTARFHTFALHALAGVPLLAAMIWIARRFAGVPGGVYLGRGPGRGSLTRRDQR
jgi:hypothetical protein